MPIRPVVRVIKMKVHSGQTSDIDLMKELAISIINGDDKELDKSDSNSEEEGGSDVDSG